MTSVVRIAPGLTLSMEDGADGTVTLTLRKAGQAPLVRVLTALEARVAAERIVRERVIDMSPDAYRIKPAH